jgi:acylphosphatase
MPAETIRVHLLIAGRVQGVTFRESARELAERLGLAGWVRNRPDGRVEVVVEGAASAVEEAVAWCRAGPPGARVTDVETRREAPTGEASFRIRRTGDSEADR